jgi:hypothetical protein
MAMPAPGPRLAMSPARAQLVMVAAARAVVAATLLWETRAQATLALERAAPPVTRPEAKLRCNRA